MSQRHFKFWPPHLAHQLALPATNVFYNAEVSAQRYPQKPFLVFYGSELTFAQFLDETRRLAGFLQQRCAVRAGDRVLLYMQNSPQFMIAYYAILRANAVVVPLNPMNLTGEVRRIAQDCGARTILLAQELYSRIEPLLNSALLDNAVVAAYSDYLRTPCDFEAPDFVRAPRCGIDAAQVTLWSDALARGLEPGALTAGPDELCVMPYTSGTTGRPRGCMHTHRSTMQTLVSGMRWFAVQPETTFLSVAPLFHVTGMQGAMNGPLYAGNTLVLLARWDRQMAAQCVQRYRVASWSAVPTMVQDFFANPEIGRYDLSSIRRLTGGGAAMPAAVAQHLLDLGVTYYEGYGLTETMGATHINPPQRAKKQCLGIPCFDVDSRIIDPHTHAELAPGEAGEIIIHAPQLFSGYWRNAEDSAAALLEIDGKRFLRTGDLGRMDEEGYFFMVDRLKRMINASGYKVWPSEVEALMYRHPAVLEACVIGSRDSYRGETVKALVVPRPEWRARIDAAEIMAWCRENMAAYKCPRIIEFVAELPKSGSGKIMWRELQEREQASPQEPGVQ